MPKCKHNQGLAFIEPGEQASRMTLFDGQIIYEQEDFTPIGEPYYECSDCGERLGLLDENEVIAILKKQK